MIKKLPPLFFTVLLSLIPAFEVSAQPRLRIAPLTTVGETITCHIGASSYQLKTDRNLISSINITGKIEEEQAIFDKVSAYTELRSNIYTVPVSDEDVNVEICPGDVNYIAYNAPWLRALYAETNNIWVLYAIIAHEVGHYVRNHDRTASGSEIQIELEADEYAGEVLAKMGASLENAQAAFKSDKMRSRGHTHPPIDQRLAAVEDGWNRIRGNKSRQDGSRGSDTRTTTMGQSGTIRGLTGRLVPILDTNRTYLYGDNIAIEGGKNQPVYFKLNELFLVEDSLGNRFKLKIASMTSETSTIEYTRLNSSSVSERSNLDIRVVNENSDPVKHAEVFAIFSDGTHLKAVADSSGNAHFRRLKQRLVTIYSAHPDYRAFYERDYEANSSSKLIINLGQKSSAGSIIIDSSGFIPGLDGQLNPILDSENRTYLYAGHISIDERKPQPVSFTLKKPLLLEDEHGKKIELRIISIIGDSSLVEFTRLN